MSAPGSARRHRRGSSDGASNPLRRAYDEGAAPATPSSSAQLPVRPYSHRSAHQPAAIVFSEDILQQNHQARATDDPKTFVDRPLKRDAEEVMQDFRQMVANGLLGSKEDMQQFIENNFAEFAHELIPEIPKDWRPLPAILNRISHPRLRLWAKQLNDLWSSLYRRVSEDVKHDSSRYSLLYVEHPVVLPGGRFMELYYWDTWWIVKGLLLCEMHATARGILDNFASLIHRFGFIPNGTRVYYLNRSQPPLYSEMVVSVLRAADEAGGEPLKGAVARLPHWVHALDDEYSFWMSQRAVSVRAGAGEHVLNRYDAPTVTAPRPESYGADVEVAEEARREAGSLPPLAARDNLSHLLFRNIAAGCESGWDFSSRWCEDGQSLRTIVASHLLPVDLNSFLLRMERNLAALHARLGESDHADAYRAAADRRTAAMEALMWDEAGAQWRDVLIDDGARRAGAFPSNFFPLWAGVLDPREDRARADRVVEALARSGLVGDAGVQASTVETGLQWDAPNCWAPIQDIIVEGLELVGTPRARDLARRIALRWLLSNYLGWKRSNCFEMHEKYHATRAGERGAGGEYLPQIGFGWTNGVVLCFLDRYGNTSSLELAHEFEEMLGADRDWRPRQPGAPDRTPPHLLPLFRFGYFHESDDRYSGARKWRGASVSPREPLDAHRGLAVPFDLSEARVPSGSGGSPTPRAEMPQSAATTAGAGVKTRPGAWGSDLTFRMAR